MSGFKGELPNDNFPADQISAPTEFIEEPMDAIVEIKEISIERNENKNNAVLYRFLFTVVEPTEFLSSPHSERFYVGSDEDPDHTLAETWDRMGGRMMKACLKNASVPLTGGLSKVFAAAIGARVGVQLRWDRPTGDYDSRIRVKAYKPLVDEKGKAFVPKKVEQAKPVAKATVGLGAAPGGPPAAPPKAPPAAGPPKPPTPPKA